MPDVYDYLERVREFNPDIIVREAGRNDGVHFVALFNSYYKRKTSDAYFQWQFFDTPYEAKLFTAFHDGKLVGYLGIKLYPLSGNIRAGFAVDLLIDEPYRKRGIGYLLGAEIMDFCKAKGIAVMAALPNAYGNAAFKSLGWKSIAKIDTLVNDDLSSVSLTDKENVLVNDDSLTRFTKDHQYRNWRYNNHPAYKYQTITLNEHNYAITKLFTDPVNGNVLGDIVEISCNDGQNQQVLLSKILDQMKTLNVRTLTTWALPHTPLYSFLAGQGFKIMPQERYFCIKLIDNSLEKLLHISNWDLEQCDAEIY
jgi:GNAT superfamily N-acetyltransferase